MLSNIVFIIILILLIIILVLLYFFSNDIRKNKNKINIIESDLNAMRERILSINQKINSLENIENMKKSSKSSMMEFDPNNPDFN
jgi:predicted PurR-regulated permease PerM